MLHGVRIDLSVELTIAWLSNPHTRASAEDVSPFLRSMHDALSALEAVPGGAQAPEPSTEFKPAVSVRKSLANPNVIVSMIDGKPYTSLTRHIGAHGLSPDIYRQRYGLKSDYPMVAPGYSAKRSELAKALGLGRKAGKGQRTGAKLSAEPTPATVSPKKRGRLSVSEAKKAAQAHLTSAE